MDNPKSTSPKYTIIKASAKKKTKNSSVSSVILILQLICVYSSECIASISLLIEIFQ